MCIQWREFSACSDLFLLHRIVYACAYFPIALGRWPLPLVVDSCCIANPALIWSLCPKHITFLPIVIWRVVRNAPAHRPERCQIESVSQYNIMPCPVIIRSSDVVQMESKSIISRSPAQHTWLHSILLMWTSAISHWLMLYQDTTTDKMRKLNKIETNNENIQKWGNLKKNEKKERWVWKNVFCIQFTHLFSILFQFPHLFQFL